MPSNIEKLGVKSFTDMEEGLKNTDIIMMLNCKPKEWMDFTFHLLENTIEFFALDYKKIKKAKADALIFCTPGQ